MIDSDTKRARIVWAIVIAVYAVGLVLGACAVVEWAS